MFFLDQFYTTIRVYDEKSNKAFAAVRKQPRPLKSNVGKIGFSDDRMRPSFEKTVFCPTCGELSMDDVFLTELGQSQMTEATWGL